MNPAAIHTPSPVNLTMLERRQITDILIGRRNELATFVDRARRDDSIPRVVQVALDRELERYSRLTEKIRPPKVEQEDDEDFNEESD